MGKIIETYAGSLRPIQLTLVRDDFRNLLKLYDKGRFSDLLPSIARYLNDEEIAVINGAHRTIISEVTGLDARLYIPENEVDLISGDSFPAVAAKHIEDANNSIKFGFPVVPSYVSNVEKSRIKTFDDLMEEYKIHTLDDIRKFVEGHIQHRWALTHRSRGDGY